jgi:hypothetical protein
LAGERLGDRATLRLRLNQAIDRALESAALRDKLASIGVIVRPGPPEAFGKFLTDERRKFSEVVKASGATVD